MALADKVCQANILLNEICDSFGHEKIAVAWTGGKDSTVTLHLWKTLLQHRYAVPPRVLNLDTGVKFPQVMAFRDSLAMRWGLDMVVAKPEVALHGYPIAQNTVTCCADLKVAPLSRAVKSMGVNVLLTGIRRDEHPDRDRPVKEERESPDVLMVHPVLEFTEMDIWAYTVEQDIPWCVLYGEGYRSLGCVPCTAQVERGDGAHERAGRAQSKEVNMDLLRSMGYF